MFSDIIYHYVIFAQNSLSRNIEKVDAQIQELIKANDILKETLKKYKFYNEKNIKALDTSVIKNIINYYYYKYKVIKKINKVIKSFEELKEDISVKNILINYDDSILSKKEKLFNKSLLNKRYFLFGTLCKIKDILNQSKNKRKKVFINAYMVKNLGDDLFLKIFINRYGEKNKLYLYVNKEYKDVLKGNFIAYKNKIIVFFNKLLKLITIDRMDIETLLSKNEILVRIGGSMFIEENNSNYKERIKKEFSIKHKYYILGSNFGPYISDDYKKTYKEVFKNAEDVCFRDQYSYELFKELPNVRYSSDIVFGLDISKINKTKGKKAVISIVDCDLKIGKGYKEKYETKILELINHLINKGYEIVLMSFCKLENDEMAIKEIYEQIDEKMKVKVSKYFYRGNIEEALNVLGESKVIIGSRFHANIIGFILNKTVIPVAYSDKTLNVLKDLKFDGKIIDIRKIDEFDVKKLTYKDLNYKISVKEQIEMANEHFKIIDNDLN